MTMTTTFHNNPLTFATSRMLIINDASLRQTTAAGNLHNFATAVTYFQVTLSPMFPNAAFINFSAVAAADHQPCYLLPYYPGADVDITLGNAAKIFFTSNLSGCGVQVSGTRQTPRVIHSNARDVFDTHGAVMARNAIDNRLAQHGQHDANVGTLTKADQEQTFNNRIANNLQAIVNNITPTKEGYTVDTNSVQLDQNASGLSGAVFGEKAANDDWTFYSQLSTPITQGTQTKKRTILRNKHADLNSENPITHNSNDDAYAVLGQPRQFWP